MLDIVVVFGVWEIVIFGYVFDLKYFVIKYL